ncbi:MAG: hypothetical protein LBB86_05240 [Oscillospiraceae bacterium]|jgi:hypothetical protein|nr:hypothetical protein [Oscillospiraceae bacterium]
MACKIARFITLVVIFLVSFCSLSASAYAKEYACVEDAVRASGLPHCGIYVWDETVYEIFGVNIMEQRWEGSNLIVSVYYSHADVDKHTVTPMVREGGPTIARITYRVPAPNEYEEIEFVMPREGDHLEPDIKNIFSADVYNLIYPKTGEFHKQWRLARDGFNWDIKDGLYSVTLLGACT